MDSHLACLAWVAVGYFVGAVPFGYLIGRMRGVDVRTVGSKNIGATNVYRTVGKGWGFLAFFCDFAKGFVPTMLCFMYAARHAGGGALAENLPVLDVLCTPALYTWIVILAFCFALRRRDRRMIAWMMFPLALLVMNLFTPTNAYLGRYMLPVFTAALFFPAFIRGDLSYNS